MKVSWWLARCGQGAALWGGWGGGHGGVLADLVVFVRWSELQFTQ